VTIYISVKVGYVSDIFIYEIQYGMLTLYPLIGNVYWGNVYKKQQL